MKIIYITKYALTQGIFVAECRMTPYEDAVSKDGQFFPKNEFRMTEEDSIKKAEDMRRRKISYLKSKLAMLGSPDFSKSDPFER